MAITLRKQIEELIPDNIEEILDFLDELRPVVRSRIEDPGKRHRILKQAADTAFREKRILSKEETESLLNEDR